MRSREAASTSWLRAQPQPYASYGCADAHANECAASSSYSHPRLARAQDSQAAVVKAALLSGTGVLRLTVVLACKQVRACGGTRPRRGNSRGTPQGGAAPQPEVAAAWSASRAFFADACSLAVGSDNSGVKLQAIKFVEAAALAYSAALSVPALLSAPLASDLRDSLQVSIGAPLG